MTAPDAGRVAYRVFRGRFATWDRLFAQAAEFAGALPPGDLISISHSAEQLDGLVVVWYRSREPEPLRDAPARPLLDY